MKKKKTAGGQKRTQKKKKCGSVRAEDEWKEKRRAMKNGARDCTLLRGRKREIKEGKTERLRKRESTVINECDTESVCEREREGDEWGLISPGWWNPVILYIHTPADGNIWRRVSVCGKKRCDVWLCLCEATKEVRDKSVCALASVRVTQMQPRKGFLGEEENVTREQRYLIFAATLEEMSTSTNTQQKRNQKLLMDKTKRSHYTCRTNCSVIVSLFILSKSLFSTGPNQSVPNQQKTVDPHVHTDRRLKFPIEQLDWAQQNKWAIHKLISAHVYSSVVWSKQTNFTFLQNSNRFHAALFFFSIWESIKNWQNLKLWLS